MKTTSSVPALPVQLVLLWLGVCVTHVLPRGRDAPEGPEEPHGAPWNPLESHGALLSPTEAW